MDLKSKLARLNGVGPGGRAPAKPSANIAAEGQAPAAPPAPAEPREDASQEALSAKPDLVSTASVPRWNAGSAAPVAPVAAPHTEGTEPSRPQDPRIASLRQLLADWSHRQETSSARRAQAPAPPPPGPLPVEARSTTFGTVHVSDCLLSPEHHHGSAPLAGALDVAGRARRQPRAAGGARGCGLPADALPGHGDDGPRGRHGHGALPRGPRLVRGPLPARAPALPATARRRVPHAPRARGPHGAVVLPGDVQWQELRLAPFAHALRAQPRAHARGPSPPGPAALRPPRLQAPGLRRAAGAHGGDRPRAPPHRRRGWRAHPRDVLPLPSGRGRLRPDARAGAQRQRPAAAGRAPRRAGAALPRGRHGRLGAGERRPERFAGLRGRGPPRSRLCPGAGLRPGGGRGGQGRGGRRGAGPGLPPVPQGGRPGRCGHAPAPGAPHRPGLPGGDPPPGADQALRARPQGPAASPAARGGSPPRPSCPRTTSAASRAWRDGWPAWPGPTRWTSPCGPSAPTRDAARGRRAPPTGAPRPPPARRAPGGWRPAAPPRRT